MLISARIKRDWRSITRSDINEWVIEDLEGDIT
jgi:hypothetical protein